MLRLALGLSSAQTSAQRDGSAPPRSCATCSSQSTSTRSGRSARRWSSCGSWHRKHKHPSCSCGRHSDVWPHCPRGVQNHRRSPARRCLHRPSLCDRLRQASEALVPGATHRSVRAKHHPAEALPGKAEQAARPDGATTPRSPARLIAKPFGTPPRQGMFFRSMSDPQPNGERSDQCTTM